LYSDNNNARRTSERTLNGFIRGFMIIRQQWADFCVSIPKVKKKTPISLKNTGYFNGYVG
jgi:hypothetical protein